jgi:dihydroflavonol-4-reductase
MADGHRFWADKRVCVTGGTGFLGYHLVRQLLAGGAQVRVVALPPPSTHPLHLLPQVETAYGDILDAGFVRRSLVDCDAIFHTAGLVAVWGAALKRMHAVHLDGTRNVLAGAPPSAQIVHTSSIVAVGAGRNDEEATEESPYNLQDLRVDYVRAKRAAEEIALEAAARGQWVAVTNPGYLIGPEDHERSIMGRFCRKFWKGRMLMASPGGFNLVDVRDVARGHLLAAERGTAGRRYILGGENRTLRSFMRLLAEVAEMRPRALPRLPLWLLRGAAGLAEGCAWLTGKEPYPSLQHVRVNGYHWFVSSDRARRELGYAPRSLRRCLEQTYRWYLGKGKVPLRGLNAWWMRPRFRPARGAVAPGPSLSSVPPETPASTQGPSPNRDDSTTLQTAPSQRSVMASR